MLCLFIAVILFRTFELEGYIISTGSMAPTLLGFHKRIVCPSCGYPFAFGIAVDTSGTGTDVMASATSYRAGSRRGSVRCPNCGQDAIDAGRLPPNDGDQLLVQKNVYEIRPPRRWEIVVLKGPVRPKPPLVKRVVGLPNEAVQIIDGDIYANGTICRKDLDHQRAVRILVSDNDYIPSDLPDEETCWLSEPSPSPWKVQGHGFAASLAASNSLPADGTQTVSWLAFRRWMRRGGNYKTEVELDAPALGVHLPSAAFGSLRFDAPRKRLVAMGALDRSERDRLKSLNTDPTVRSAIDTIYERSHEAPITDEYGYNPADVGLLALGTRDIMLECDATFDSEGGQLLFDISDGRHTYRLTLDRSRKETSLTIANHGEALRTAPLAADAHKPLRVELSVFDRQVVAAVDGTLLFPAWEEAATKQVDDPPRRPLRIGARGAAARITSLKVYRDIHYTRGQGRNGVDRPIRLAANEYFVLGDNSPVSNDGRSWPEGAVKESQLIGKPLVVHLPSREGEFTIGGHTRYIRIPDFRRMRYIR